MKNLLNIPAIALLILAFGCSLDSATDLQELSLINEKEYKNTVSDQSLSNFMEKNGILTANIEKIDDGYILDDCILISHQKLSIWDSLNNNPNFQTKTQSIITVPSNEIRTITYRISSEIPFEMKNLINEVINSYNSIRNFNIKFQSTQLSNEELLFQNGNSGLGRADWPTNGNSGRFVQLNVNSLNNSIYTDAQRKFVIAHEIGHIMGFRHTDWIEQNEGLYGFDDGYYTFIGASLIPATFDNDPYSIYNSGPYYFNRRLPIPSFSDFNYTDLLAIRYLYSKDITEKPLYSYISTGSGWAIWTTNWNIYQYGNQQYGFWGVTGYIYSIPVTGSTALHKYTHSSGTPYISTSANIHLLYPSYTYDGQIGHVFTSSAISRTPVYEWYNPNVGFFFTTNSVDNYVAGPGWTGGGIAFYVMSLGTI